MNEQKVASLNSAAVFSNCCDPVLAAQPNSSKSYRRIPTANDVDKRECFYCHEKGHLIAVCLSFERKEYKKSKSPLPVALVQTKPSLTVDVDCAFISKGSVSLADGAAPVPVTILRDIAAKQFLILDHILPFSAQSYCDSDVLACCVRPCILSTCPRN